MGNQYCDPELVFTYWQDAKNVTGLIFIIFSYRMFLEDCDL